MATAQANGNASSPIPIVDFGKFLKGSLEDKKDTAAQLDDAFRNVGFVYIKNYGVSLDEVTKCFEWVITFSTVI